MYSLCELILFGTNEDKEEGGKVWLKIHTFVNLVVNKNSEAVMKTLPHLSLSSVLLLVLFSISYLNVLVLTEDQELDDIEDEENDEYMDEYFSGNGSGSEDYYYDYYEGESRNNEDEDSEERENEEKAVMYKPKMLTEPTKHHVSVGEDVSLDCEATNSSEFVRIWVKDGQMLFTGSIMLYRSDRFSLKESSLYISRVSQEDSGVYTCSIMVKEEELSVQHTLNVIKAFFIKKYPNDGNVEIKVGESGKNIMQYSVEGNELYISNATVNDAGQYYCYAKKEDGDKSATSSFMVKILFAPKILSLDQSTFRTGEGYSLEMTCTVVSQPNSKVTWYKGNEVVKLDKRVQTQTAGSRHVLIINSIESNDVGVYMCYATNKAGTHQEQIDFSRSNYESRIQDLSPGNGAEFSTKITKSGYESIPEDVVSKMEELEKVLYAEKQALSEFRKGIELELNALRNLTYTAINSSSGYRNDSPNGETFVDTKFENDIFEDIERINMNLRRLEQTYEDQIQRLSEFSSEAKDDFLRLWDKVNELQEVTNQTTGNIEEIYDKDILILQNFRNDAKADIEKLRFEINNFLEEVQNFIPKNNSFYGGAYSSLEMETKLRRFEVEFKSIQSMIEKLKDDTFIVADELKGVHQDLDTFKKFQRHSSTLHLKIGRRIDKINEENLVDLEHRMNFYDTKIGDFDEFREKTDERLRAKKMKSQIYYLQQSILQLRNAEMESSQKQRIKNTLRPYSTCRKKIRTNEETSIIEEMKEISDTMKKVMKRLDVMESNSKKYNLIIAGIPPSRRLERANHLEKSVREFFKEKLDLTDVQISDIERIRHSNKDKIRVKFPSIMEKFRILRLSRSKKAIRITEDFSDSIILSRRKLIAFARKRSTKSKQKWALKYDELFYNGRSYIYDQTSERVVQKIIY
ncbi:TTN [Lepeophtheirus salmonis]|uniref:TTN n=1 Tax=Lepeophtheirus salmonis TaxID=72036 RepID=A0A7R8HA89_LEPSM|nr:TTN [Lepeophtheirus salmonis]CAF2968411.1 TTN [Lepeophtheirus salmonis]